MSRLNKIKDGLLNLHTRLLLHSILTIQAVTIKSRIIDDPNEDNWAISSSMVFKFRDYKLIMLDTFQAYDQARNSDREYNLSYEFIK